MDLFEYMQMILIMMICAGCVWLYDKLNILKAKIDALSTDKRAKEIKIKVVEKQQLRRKRAAAQRLQRWSVLREAELKRKQKEAEMEADREAKEAEKAEMERKIQQDAQEEAQKVQQRMVKVVSARMDGVMRSISERYATKLEIDMESEARTDAIYNAQSRMDMLEAGYNSMRDRLQSLEGRGGSTSVATSQQVASAPPPRRRGKWGRLICV